MAEDANTDPLAYQKFADSDGITLTTDHAITKAAMAYLIESWPRSIPFDSVFKEARARLNLNPQDRAALEAQTLSHNLLTAFSRSAHLVEFKTYTPGFATVVSECPIGSPWARLQIEEEGYLVTNLRHDPVVLNPVQAHILRYLDGTRDRAALVEALVKGPVAVGSLTVKQDGVPLQDIEKVREMLGTAVDEALSQLARLSLLVA